jgi:hypothetical protein
MFVNLERTSLHAKFTMCGKQLKEIQQNESLLHYWDIPYPSFTPMEWNFSPAQLTLHCYHKCVIVGCIVGCDPTNLQVHEQLKPANHEI